MTMMEIRAKSRRLKQKADLKLNGGGLPAADELGQAGQVTPAGSVGVLPQMKLLSRNSRFRSSRSRSSTVVRAPTSGRCCRIFASPVRSSRTADMVILVHRPDAWEIRRSPGRQSGPDRRRSRLPSASISVAHPHRYSGFTEFARSCSLGGVGAGGWRSRCDQEPVILGSGRSSPRSRATPRLGISNRLAGGRHRSLPPRLCRPLRCSPVWPGYLFDAGFVMRSAQGFGLRRPRCADAPIARNAGQGQQVGLPVVHGPVPEISPAQR